MFEKIKKIFKEKDEKKKTENLIVFLIILVITLIVINNILKDDSKNQKDSAANTPGVELVNKNLNQTIEVSNMEEYDLEKKLEEILSKISGVGEVKVLLTYYETGSISPIYNESTSSSTSTDSNRNNYRD